MQAAECNRQKLTVRVDDFHLYLSAAYKEKSREIDLRRMEFKKASHKLEDSSASIWHPCHEPSYKSQPFVPFLKIYLGNTQLVISAPINERYPRATSLPNRTLRRSTLTISKTPSKSAQHWVTGDVTLRKIHDHDRHPSCSSPGSSILSSARRLISIFSLYPGRNCYWQERHHRQENTDRLAA